MTTMIKTTCIQSLLLACIVLNVQSQHTNHSVFPDLKFTGQPPTGGEVIETTPWTEPPPMCSDENDWCAEWAKDGQCTNTQYKPYMLDKCKKSCGGCGQKTTARSTAQPPPPICKDDQDMCEQWSKKGECNSKEYKTYMMSNCKKSCGVCSDVTITTVTVTEHPSPPSPCKDDHNMCKDWAKEGECDSKVYKTFMMSNCKMSCGLCGDVTTTTDTSCIDKNKDCEMWAEKQYCGDKQFGRYMMYNCKKSCDVCEDVKATQEPCLDTKKTCGYWYLSGECVKNAKYMSTVCRRSCGICSDGESILGCRDTRKECKYWASIGECQKNSGFMLLNCRVSCKACIPDPGPDAKCEDVSKNCKEWVKNGECTKNPKYMNEKCASSCKKC